MGLKRMWRKWTRPARGQVTRNVRVLPAKALRDADVIVTTNEVSERHGTGVILRRIFGRSPNVLSIRSTNLHPDHALGEHQATFGHDGLSRSESFAHVLNVLNGTTVRRVLCVPYLADELITAIVLKELFNAPLCVFVMDDNNIHARGIPDELMREALGKASLRLAISPELRDAYEQKFGLKFWVVPPVVDPQALRTTPLVPRPAAGGSSPGVLVGSLWSRPWLDLFRKTVKGAGLEVHWYGNAKATWLNVSPEELRQDGIIDCGFVPEPQLAEKLQDYSYALVPSGTLDETDDRPEIARLSLPTRMPFLLAAANLPTLVLGNPQTAAARFLKRFPFGNVVPYDSVRLRTAAEDICSPEQQRVFRAFAARSAPLFSAEGLDKWIWQSLEQGEPADERFETPFTRSEGDIIQFIDPPVPKDLHGDFGQVYLTLKRLRCHGFSPDFVIDVGASTGVWSDTAKRIFPRARYLLIEPLHAQYVRINKWYFKRNPDFEAVPAAVSDKPGEARLNVSPDLYGSSLLHPEVSSSGQTITVPVMTLDQIAAEKNLAGRGLLKVDVQFTEHLVLAGARQLLQQVDALILELSLFRYAPEALLFPEMCDLVRGLGFHYYEDMGGWRSPVDGTTLQKDVLFVRDSLFVQGSRKPAERNGVHAAAQG
ncbi:MAG TPA: FkbM family methyltransferase [Verrucomicrobiae bacterium]|nr:FkbM family methyltransferase [Verrucomicrobiae bacterium]